jgi:hypothetical protein
MNRSIVVDSSFRNVHLQPIRVSYSIGCSQYVSSDDLELVSWSILSHAEVAAAADLASDLTLVLLCRVWHRDPTHRSYWFVPLCTYDSQGSSSITHY